ncbi:uncharacterized protein HD556DRAFT_1409233 [Suillus plorans]|uniref:Uncharacterized protein n=1 Tax=Suillus plorans TaxID=116603 RepID=A0A9P7AFU8_9AGAM|nr:uncharacterized protein HD556DRAFT_1409233 [Suillus plorans]KAG1787434.1 hypothetical protein HD556DRAFT_1409233 [Suillus plorans]
MKLDGLESFRLQTILRVFLVLLQISLLLFGLSLSANMWAQQTTISSVIICTTAFGILFYVGTFLVSVLHPDSPFRTPASDLLATICQKIYPGKSTSIRHTLAKSSAIRWILETSTNPEIVEAAATIVPCVQWPPNLDASAAFARLRDSFVACRNRPELYVKYGKAMAHLCIQPVKINKELLGFLWDDKFNQSRSRFIRDAFMAGCAAYKQLKSSREDNARRRKHRASARTALRTMLVHGTRNKLSRPDDEHLIWYGDLRWRHSDEREPSYEKFNWLVDYLGDAENHTDHETEGDALLALSSMRRLGSPAKRPSYINSLIRCMHSTKPPRVRHTALRAVFEAREELASMTSASMPQGVDAQLLDGLSSALMSAVRPNDYHTIHDTRPDGSFHKDRDFCYIRLIYALTEKNEWCHRLIHHGHLKWCIFLVNDICRDDYLRVGSCLLVIFERAKSLGEDLPFSPAEKRRQFPIAEAWHTAQYASRDDPYVDGIQALVMVTRLHLTALDDSVPREWFADLAAKVHRALVNLQQKQTFHVNAGIAQAEIDAAISSMKDLHTDLGHMVEEWNISQRDDEASGS